MVCILSYLFLLLGLWGCLVFPLLLLKRTSFGLQRRSGRVFMGTEG